MHGICTIVKIYTTESGLFKDIDCTEKVETPFRIIRDKRVIITYIIARLDTCIRRHTGSRASVPSGTEV